MRALRSCHLFLLALAALPLSAQNRPQIQTGPNLPDGQVNTLYSASLSARGGNTPYVWSVTDGTLPDGVLLIGLTGTLVGLPSTAGELHVHHSCKRFG